MPHLADRIIAPRSLTSEGVLFDIPLKPYPGKPIVCMVPRDNVAGNSFEFNGRTVQLELPPEVGAKYQPDFGVVAAFAPRRDAQGNILYSVDLQLERGMLVAVKPYTGVWYDHSCYPWIPEGRWLKILGTVDEWHDNILAAVEP